MLPLAQFAATAVVDAEAGHDAVDDEEAVFVRGEAGREEVQELVLMLNGVSVSSEHLSDKIVYLAVLGSSIGDVLLSLIGINCRKLLLVSFVQRVGAMRTSEAFSDLSNTTILSLEPQS